MLPKRSRLGRDEFDRVFRMGKRFHAPHFQLIYAPQATLTASVVVAKKLTKTAVARNKLRRRVYDILRRYAQDAGMQGAFILIAKAGVLGLPYETLKTEIVGLIGSLGKTR